MDQQLVPVSLASAAGGDSFGEALAAQRARLREFCTTKRRRLAELRGELARDVQLLTQFDGDVALADLQQALAQARQEREERADDAARYQQKAADQARLVLDLRQQLETLTQENALLQDTLAAREAGRGLADDEQQELEDLRRRYEMALDDLKTERARCRELEDKLLRSPTATLTGISGGSDWESQKRRLLAALADFDDDDSQEHAERVQIEEVIRRTDAAVASKQREINELKRLLDEQSANVGAMGDGAAAVAELLDKDEVIQQERKNLEALQSEWREKLRTAEVEISMQRAKLARQQAQLEDRAQDLDNMLRGSGPPEAAVTKSKPARGRWLRRLGLKGGDEEL